jgi:stearoyl-CoA desaturase (delta-9 desaturase)
VQLTVVSLLVIGPAVALIVGIPLLWGDLVHLRDLVLAVALYAISGHGISVGYHRLFTHRSFKANRWLKIALASAGSMAVEGSLIGWVAAHRRHHRFTDRPGDPHSPNLHGRGTWATLRGFMHAHVGWLFLSDETSATQYAKDLLADRDLVRISRLFPVFALASLAVPFGVGWLWSGTLVGGLGALLWAGLVRMAFLHHITWSVNSVCHLFGRRPFRTGDRSANFAPLALLSFGESWHNLHHSYPNSARLGALPHQVDTSAGLIRLFERAGWATHVRWPTAEHLAAVAAA